MLTEAQLAALERTKQEKEAHGEFESECPGYCGAQDTFYVGNMKCKSRYSICRTLSDRSGRAALASLPRRRSAALKPGACGAPLRGCGA